MRRQAAPAARTPPAARAASNRPGWQARPELAVRPAGAARPELAVRPTRGGAPGTDGGTPDTSGATDVRPDLSGDAPAIVLTGRRSFVVTSTLSYEAGVTGPPSHTFTIVVDADALKAISGGAGEGTLSSMEKLGLVYRFIGMTRFALSSGCMSSVNYVDLQFHVDPSGVLMGTGAGTLTLVTGDVGRVVLVRSSLSGVPDTQRPTLTPTSGPLTDPLSSVTVSTTEPLPRGMTPMLVSAGESIPLAAPPTPEAFVYQFSKPARMLHYARQYQLITDGIADFAGNAATAGLGFMTEAPPPLAPEDGFEAVTAATLGGGQVLSGSGAPVIAGTRSLYVPPTSSPATPAVRLALRLPVAAGDTTFAFSYRTVNPGYSSGVFFRIGSEGRSVVSLGLPGDPVQTTPATINGSSVALGPVTTFRTTLPADVGSELVFQRTVQAAGCGLPLPPFPGIIIDDLRVE